MSHVVGRPGTTPEPSWARSFEGTAYRFVQLLGHGGMGTVFEAEHRALGTRVAVKVLHEGLAGRDDLVDRLRLEAQTLARLSHPNVVQVSDLGRTHDGLAFYVMEKLEGRTLRAELEARGALDGERALAIVRATLEGLAAAHAMGIVHRDVKPENIFLSEPSSGVRSVKLLDFGIAKVLAESRGVANAPQALAFTTREALILGTPMYLSPEQISGGAISPAVDVYASGLVLYRMLAGRHPFEGRSRDAVMRAHLEETPARLSGVPSEIEAALARALAKDPRDRLRDARALLDALAGVHVFGSAVETRRDERPAETLTTVAQVRAEHDAAALYAPAATLPSVRVDALTAEAEAPASSSERRIGLFTGFVALATIAFRGAGVMSVTRDQSEALQATFGAQSAAAIGIVDSVLLPAVARHSLLLVSSTWLAIVSFDLIRLGPNALGRLRTWSRVSAALAIFALALDAFFVAPAQSALAALTSADEGASDMSSALVYGMACVTAALHLAFAALCAALARKRGVA